VLAPDAHLSGSVDATFSSAFAIPRICAPASPVMAIVIVSVAI
jgi:hypothetical protein